MIFRLFVYNIEQFPETLLKDVDYETKLFNCDYAMLVLYSDL